MYFEMIQLQFDVFKMVVKVRGEDFVLGKIFFWDLVMKYFLFINWEWLGKIRRIFEDFGDYMMLFIVIEFQVSQYVEILDIQDVYIIMVMYLEWMKLVIVCLKLIFSLVVYFIQVLVIECMIFWGCLVDNICLYEFKLESRVLKYVFKFFLWKNNFDVIINRNWWFWNKCYEFDEEEFMFYICIKVINGIWINGEKLCFYLNENKKVDGFYKYWVFFYDGDCVFVWQIIDGNFRIEFIFCCVWGGSVKFCFGYGF